MVAPLPEGAPGAVVDLVGGEPGDAGVLVVLVVPGHVAGHVGVACSRADGRGVEVLRLRLATAHNGRAYNLSVEGIHTYHVGNDAILVHNECGTPRMLGADGTQLTSRTLMKSERGYRIDVENPAPGVRPGQLHLQMGRDTYLYDFDQETFVGAPRSPQRTISSNPDAARAIEMGERYLGFL